DVPNFKRSQINFEAFLKRAIDTEDSRPAIELKRSRERHVSNYQPVNWRSVEPRRVLDYLSTEKNNGNNVNAEEEFMASLENQLRYTLMTQATAYEFNQVNQIVRA
ncbi:MAG: flagellar basal body rod protein FlgB, partial [Spirochaetales bacterium]